MEHGVVVIFASVCCRMNLAVTVVCLLMLNVLVNASGNNNNYYCKIMIRQFISFRNII